MRSIYAIFSLFFIYTMSSCDNEIKDANQVVNQFYSSYKPGDFRIVDKSFLSKELGTQIDKATLMQAEDAKRLKAIGSTDKPLMIEGDIYTSLMEGATSHEIIRSDIANGTVKAEVKFVNNHYNHTWNDTVVLINEGGSWKIDNILYTPKQGGVKSIRDLLDSFISIK